MLFLKAGSLFRAKAAVSIFREALHHRTAKLALTWGNFRLVLILPLMPPAVPVLPSWRSKLTGALRSLSFNISRRKPP